VNDTRSAKNVEYEQLPMIPSSGSWNFSQQTLPQTRVVLGSEVLRNASVAFLFAVSSLTAITDPWFVDRHRRVPVSGHFNFASIRRRRITLAEALKLADEIMLRAEAGRTTAMVEEARRHFDMENSL